MQPVGSFGGGWHKSERGKEIGREGENRRVGRIMKTGTLKQLRYEAFQRGKCSFVCLFVCLFVHSIELSGMRGRHYVM